MNDYKKEQLLSILSSILGDYSDHSNDECSFHCPFCHHHKRKLAINLSTQDYHCWVCGSKGRSLHRLMKRLNADESILIQLRGIIGKSESSFQQIDEIENVIFNLPKEFIPLWKINKSIERKHALKYIKKRGITNDDIIKYNIGYCEDGLYKGYVIIPSYSKMGRLNYFVARSYRESFMKYKNPPISKNTVLFENTISWNLPIILTEGVFDAIAIKRNAIPLLGKQIQTEVYDALLRNNVKEVYVVLDSDAKKDALDIVERLRKQHIKTYFVGLNELDPSDLGFKRVTDMIKNTKETQFSDLIKLKFS